MNVAKEILSGFLSIKNLQKQVLNYVKKDAMCGHQVALNGFYPGDSFFQRHRIFARLGNRANLKSVYQTVSSRHSRKK